MKDKLYKHRHSNWLPTVTAIVSFVFGIIGGKLLETLINPLFNSETKAIMVGLFTLGLFMVVLLIIVTTFSSRVEEREQIWLSSFGSPAELVFEQGDINKGEYYYKLISFLEKVSAGDEILVMSQHRLNDKASEAVEKDVRRQAREVYSRLLLEKAHQEGITYRRIICFEEGTTKGDIGPDRLKEWLVNHCRELLEIKKKRPDKVSLKKSKTKISADIFIITGKVGTLVVDIYDPQAGVTHKNGAAIFHNPPNGRIIEQLRDWFMEIDGEEGTISVSQVQDARARI